MALFQRVLTVAAVALAALSVACSSAGPAAPGGGAPAAGGGPKIGGILKMDLDREAQNFNPMLKEGGVEEAVLGGVYIGLLRPEMSEAVGYTGLKILPYMAESWEVSPDSTSYTFKLRKDLKWQNKPPVNGRPITSDDIKYNLLRFRDEKVSMAKFMVEDVTDVQTPDPYTVKVQMKQPFAPFLAYMAWDKALFHPKELVDANGLDDNPVGSGPFMLESFERGVMTKLKKNPDFFMKDEAGRSLPYLDGYQVFKILDASTAAAAFISGQLDMCGLCARVSDPLVDTVKSGSPDTVFSSALDPGGTEIYMANHKAPFNDVKVRQALRIGLDVDGMVAALTKGKGSASVAGIGAAYKDLTLPAAEVKALYPHDVAKAKQLLKDAGITTPPPVTIHVGSNSQPVITFTELLASQMKEIGFDPKISVVDFAEIITRRRAGDYQIFTSGKSQEIDPDGNLYPVYNSKGELNYSRIVDPQLDALLVKQRITLDQAERKKTIQDITRRIADQAYSMNPVADVLVKYWHPYVKGYVPHMFWGYGQKFLMTYLDR